MRLPFFVSTNDKLMNVGLIDYGAGNLHSVQNALAKVGVESTLVRSPEDMKDVMTLILPGVGACVDCVQQLKKQDLWQPLKEWLCNDRPYLGICLGYQVLFDHSDEFDGADGLGIIPGKVVRFPRNDLKVPHMGWNAIEVTDPKDPLWKGLPDEPYVYFVHSFYPQPKDNSVVSARCDYGVKFAAAIRRGNLVATQFHPEKSQQIGLTILKNFIEQASKVLVAG